ncbi:hypothetical protein [Actinoplanes sp. G11-F43]
MTPREEEEEEEKKREEDNAEERRSDEARETERTRPEGIADRRATQLGAA